MEEMIKALQEKVSEALRALDGFNAEFKKNYTNQVKIAEASHTNYANLIVASKEELAKLNKQKDDVVNSSLELVEEAKLKIKTEKDNFNKIMQQEQARLDAEYAKFDKLSKDYSFMEKETIQLNQESKAVNVKAKEDLSKVEALKEELECKVDKYDSLLSSVSQQKVRQDNVQKDLDILSVKVIKSKEEIDAQEQALVKTSNALTAKKADLENREKTLVIAQKELNNKKLELEKLQSNLIIAQANIDKEKEIITHNRSNLAAKESNLIQLEKELLEKKD